MESSTIGGANVQVGGDVHGSVLAGDVTVQVVVNAAGLALHTDEAAVLAAAVRRYRRRNRSARPAIMADHPGVSGLVERLSASNARRVLVVHGRAGVGKTSVVADALDDLVSGGWIAGVLRMDAIGQVSVSAADLGAMVSLSDSPVVAIDKVAGDAPRVVVIDQLDAVSTYSGRMPDSYDAVMEMLEQLEDHPRVKLVLVVRTVDLVSDPRMRSLLSDKVRVESLEIGDLEPGAVRAALQASGVDATALSPATLDLLRVPLHLAVFSRLDGASQHLAYRTLPDLYEQFTKQVRQTVETEVGGLDMNAIVTALVRYMSDNESLQAPASVLDAVPRRQVSALASAGLLVEDTTGMSFFHETYFDFQFARAFVAEGRDLHDFLIESGQQLFRRAQTRQVLEFLAGFDRRLFRDVIVRLLGSSTVRAHLLDVVIGVLSQLDATGEDWLAVEDLAFGQSRRNVKLLGLVSLPNWFDAVDQAERWEALLADANKATAAANQLIIAARQRPERVSQLVRPHIGTSEEWTQRLRALVQWSLRPGLVDLTVELAESGILDDVRGPMAVNSDFWSIVRGIKDDDPAGAARIIGAYLRRAWIRAQEAGSVDPFVSGHLNEHSSAGGSSTITDIATAAPGQFLVEVLPFLVDVLRATGIRDNPDDLLNSPRWSYRYVSPTPQVDDALFIGVETALCANASQLLATRSDLIETLTGSDLEALRFLGCRFYTAAAEQASNEAIDWLLSDPRNLSLGWSDSPRWATRQLIEVASQHCDDQRITHLCAVLLDYYPGWETTAEGRRARGHGQYELLSAIPAERRPVDCARRVAELERKFPSHPPTPPRPIEVHFVGSPVPEAAAEFMTDEDWLRAIAKHDNDRTDHSRDLTTGGARELALMLGRRAQLEPERFARLALTFDTETPAEHIRQVIEAVADKIPIALLTQLCTHARHIAGTSAGREICRAVETAAKQANDALVELLEHYAHDPDPDHEVARTAAFNGQLFYGGDLRRAGINCTRGQAAEAIGDVLFAQPGYADQLLPTVVTLANDPIIAVRAQAAIPLTALLNTHADAALDLAHQLFNESPIDLFESEPVIRLLTYATLRAPQRFGAHLTRALGGPDKAAENAGHTWVVALINNCLDPSISTDPTTLSTAARRGAARALATAPDAKPDTMVVFFDDTDPSVRDATAAAIRGLDQTDTTTTHTLVSAFTTSAAFTTHFDALFHALQASLRLLPEAVLHACDRAIDIAGADLGDMRTSSAAVSPDIVAVVLRLYRQGNATIRTHCLDIIDRLADINAYGLDSALIQER